MLQLMVCDIVWKDVGLRRGREIDSFGALPCSGIIGYGLFIRDLTEYDINNAPAVCRLGLGSIPQSSHADISYLGVGPRPSYSPRHVHLLP